MLETIPESKFLTNTFMAVKGIKVILALEPSSSSKFIGHADKY